MTAISVIINAQALKDTLGPLYPTSQLFLIPHYHKMSAHFSWICSLFFSR